MTYRFGFPSLGQKVKVRTSSDPIEGLVVGIRYENNLEFCEIILKDDNKYVCLINDIIDYDVTFGTFEDIILHLSGKNSSRHCSSCYLSALYALDLLENLPNSHPFLVRKDIIKYGIMNYLGEEFLHAAHILIPQSEEILNCILMKEGLLETEGTSFMVWTGNHPNSEYRGRRSLDLVDRIRGAIYAENKSCLKPFISRVDLLSITCAANKLSKYKLDKIQEHELSAIIILLHALYHATLGKPVSSADTRGRAMVSPKEIPGIFYHGIDFDNEESWFPRLNLLNTGALFTPDYIAYVEPNLGSAHTSIHLQDIEYLKNKAFCGMGALSPRAGKYVWGASLIRSGFHLFKGTINPVQFTQDEETEIIKKSDIEVKFEEIRRVVNLEAASRLNCIFLADNLENIKRMFDYNPRISILEVSIPAAIRFTRADSKWYEEYCRTGDEENIEKYWRGVQFGDTPDSWEYLVDGRIQVNDIEKLKYILGEDEEE